MGQEVQIGVGAKKVLILRRFMGGARYGCVVFCFSILQGGYGLCSAQHNDTGHGTGKKYWRPHGSTYADCAGATWCSMDMAFDIDVQIVGFL